MDTSDGALLEARYHVPRSQVWAKSGGRQSGNVHLHYTGFVLLVGRISRTHGQALCGRSGWYERPPEGAHELADEALCPRCREIADRLSSAGALERG
jgi:hypothetical protein